MKPNLVQFELNTYEGKDVIFIRFEYNPGLIERVKKLVGVQWKAYSSNTINTYRNEFAQLLYILKDKNVVELDADRLRSYFLYCIKTLKLSENTLHSRINAVKFYFEAVLKREKLFVEIPRPKKPSIMPKVIHTQDIKRLFEVTRNLKHNTMLKLCYGMG